MSEKIDFKSKTVKRPKKSLYNNKGVNYLIAFTIVNICASYIRAPNYIKQLLADQWISMPYVKKDHPDRKSMEKYWV